MAPRFLSLPGVILAYLVYTYGFPAYKSLGIFGAFRTPGSSPHDVVVIPDTVNCEDIHYEPLTGNIFTACEDNVETRFGWFPPLANFDDPELGRKGKGSIHVIDPKTMKSERLTFENFDSTFVTHGIDVIPDLERADEAVYIIAINHVPDPKLPRARSQLEIFHHVLGSSFVRHIRSVWHPLIRTPNDVFASSPTSIYVSNDHYYRDHGIMRTLEDFWFHAKWTDTVHVEVDLKVTGDSAAGVQGNVALSNFHNNNGLGHGRSADEILIASCTSGEMHIGKVSEDQRNGNITLVDVVGVDAIVDNPTYFDDPYAKSTGDNRSGFLLPGLAKALELAGTHREPDATNSVIVYFVRPNQGKPGSATTWEKRVLFEDDGKRIRSASGSVLVAIDPESEPERASGARKGWLFVTGFQSKNVIAVKVDL
ncbi:hypothetical protein OQA88_4420 [Cercophora sp. LCS_1]